jgi:hypothetical protein
VRTAQGREAEAKVAANGQGNSQGNSQANMIRNSQKGRTPEQIRAGNLRLGLILLAIVAAFFASAIVKQVYFSTY